MKSLSLFVVGLLAEEICYLPIDVLFLQDTTGSFVDDLPMVLQQIPAMLSQILKDHPDSRFAVAEFKDKPYFPLGESDDFCWKLQTPLTGDISEFEAAYGRLYASGGADEPEAQFEALIQSAYNRMVGWRELRRTSRAVEDDVAGARIIILSTDATIHLPGDTNKIRAAAIAQGIETDIPLNLPRNTGRITKGDTDYECRTMDYASNFQASDALKAAGIYLTILTPNNATIVPTWKYVNEGLLKQPADFYQFIEADSRDVIDGVLRAVNAVTQTACAIPPTSTSTTPEPTTERVSTETSTTPESVTETSTTPESVTETSTTPESVTETSTTPESVTKTSTTPESVTKTSTTPESATGTSTTPESTTGTSTTPESTTGTSTTPESTTGTSMTPESTTGTSMTPEPNTERVTTETCTTFTGTQTTTPESTTETTATTATPEPNTERVTTETCTTFTGTQTTAVKTVSITPSPVLPASSITTMTTAKTNEGTRCSTVCPTTSVVGGCSPPECEINTGGCVDPCNPSCEMPDVVIKLLKRPKSLVLDISS